MITARTLWMPQDVATDLAKLGCIIKVYRESQKVNKDGAYFIGHCCNNGADFDFSFYFSSNGDISVSSMDTERIKGVVSAIATAVEKQPNIAFLCADGRTWTYIWSSDPEKRKSGLRPMVRFFLF